MEYYGIGKFAELIGVTRQSLMNWDKTGRLKPHHVGESGYRYYSREQLYHYLGLQSNHTKNRKVAGYCRVSSSKQKDDLERQIELVEDLIQIVTVFSCKLQGRRAHKAKKRIKELMEDDKSCEGAAAPD